MKKLLLFVLCCLPLVAMAQAFEGAIRVSYSQPVKGVTGSGTWTLKGPQVASKMSLRYDKGAMNLTMLFDSREETAYMLTDGGKVTAVPRSSMKDQGEGGRLVVHTEDTKTILGHPCVKVTGVVEGNATTMWVATDIAFDFNMFASFLKMPQPVTPIQGFPLDMKQVDASGQVVMEMKAEGVDRRTVNASEVTVPTGPVENLDARVKVQPQPNR